MYRIVLVAALLMSCPPMLPVENAPCPCAEGWVCCEEEKLCVTDLSFCAADSGKAPEGDGGFSKYCRPNECQIGGACGTDGQCSFQVRAGEACSAGICDSWATCVSGDAGSGIPEIFYVRRDEAYVGSRPVDADVLFPGAAVVVSGINFPREPDLAEQVMFAGSAIRSFRRSNERELSFNIGGVDGSSLPGAFPLVIRSPNGFATTMLRVVPLVTPDVGIGFSLQAYGPAASDVLQTPMYGVQGIAMTPGVSNYVRVSVSTTVKGVYDYGVELASGDRGWSISTVSPLSSTEAAGGLEEVGVLVSNIPGCGRETLTFKATRRADADGPSMVGWLDVPLRRL